MERVSLCPQCTKCPEVVIEGDTIRIGYPVRQTRPGVIGRPAPRSLGRGVHLFITRIRYSVPMLRMTAT